MGPAHRPLTVAQLQFFDIETTGLRPDRGAKITEMALVRQGQLHYTWARDAQKGDAPDTDLLGGALPRVLELLCDGIVVGHNLAFDLRFLAYEAERRGRPLPALRFIDTLGLARRVLGRGSNAQLGALLGRFGIAPRGPLHTAAVDARATEALFWALCETAGLETLADAGMKRLRW